LQSGRCDHADAFRVADIQAILISSL
jgi:hypothetical protein